MDEKQLLELNEQMRQALEMINQSQKQTGFNFGNIPAMMQNATNGIEGENYQEAIVQVMGAIAQLNTLAENIMQQNPSEQKNKK